MNRFYALPAIPVAFLLMIVAAICAITFALPAGITTALLALTALTFLCRTSVAAFWRNIILWLVLAPLTFWVATWRPAGFSYPLLLQLHNAVGDVAFSLHANIAKGLAGFILLLLLWPKRNTDEHRAPRVYCWLLLIFSPAIILVTGVMLLDLHWQPKLLQHIIIFAVANLLLTCVAEEAFLRLLLQQPLITWLTQRTDKHWLSEMLPVLLLTLIFVVIHTGLSGAAIWLYALAGFCYALSYSLSKNILFSIALHFAVNLGHFALLTYPL